MPGVGSGGGSSTQRGFPAPSTLLQDGLHVPRQQCFESSQGRRRGQMLKDVAQVLETVHVVGAARSRRVPDYAEGKHGAAAFA